MRAFTLVEMLIVIGVLALLLAILIPSVSAAKNHAYDARCKSNLHQLHSALSGGQASGPPRPYTWISFVRSAGAGAVLRCPSHDPNAPGGAPPAGVTMNVVEIPPPPSVVFNALESNSLIRMFVEKENFVLPRDVRVNLSAPGTYGTGAATTSATIPAGTVVNCYFLHYDPVGSGSASSKGQVTFSAEIIGVICLDADLDATDGLFGVSGTAYATGQGSRGYEFGAEVVTLDAAMRVFTIDRYKSSFPGEDIRIITAVGGGITSYGMNNRVRRWSSRPGQLVLVEYGKGVVDYDGRPADDDPADWLAPRHFGKANALFADGSVRGLTPAALAPSNADIWKR